MRCKTLSILALGRLVSDIRFSVLTFNSMESWLLLAFTTCLTSSYTSSNKPHTQHTCADALVYIICKFNKYNSQILLLKIPELFQV